MLLVLLTTVFLKEALQMTNLTSHDYSIVSDNPHLMFLNFCLQLLHLYTQWTMQGTVFNIYQTEVTTRGVLCEKVVLKNFSKLTRKHLCQSLFFNKVAGLRLFFNHIQKLPGDS